MLQPQPNLPQSTGLGYGFAIVKGEKFLAHSGHNRGWHAEFRISISRRDGFVLASNSDHGGKLNDALNKLWLKACRGIDIERQRR